MVQGGATEIKPLSQNLYDKYDRFLRRHEESLFYYSLKFKDFLRSLLGCQEDYLVAVKEGQVAGILPLMSIEGKYGRVYNSLPYFGSNGGIIADGEEAFKALTEECNKRMCDSRVAAATIISNPLLEQDYSTIEYDLTDTRISMLTSLKTSNPSAEILSRIDSTARRNIKKALGSGIEVRIANNETDFLKDIHQQSMAAIGGRVKSDVFFKLFPQHFTPGEDYNLYVAEKEGKLVAALLLFYYHKTAEYYIPVTKEEYRPYQPMSLILLQAMVDASQRDYLWWNWGGTWVTQEGVYRFKKKWATTEGRYTYYTKVNNEEIYSLSPKSILEEYGHFYVIPFNALSKKNEQ